MAQPFPSILEKSTPSCIKWGGRGGGGGEESSNYVHVIHICTMYAMYFKFKQVKRYLVNLSNMLKENQCFV